MSIGHAASQFRYFGDESSVGFASIDDSLVFVVSPHLTRRSVFPKITKLYAAAQIRSLIFTKKIATTIKTQADLNPPPPETTLAVQGLKAWQLWVILLANGLFALLANLLFYFRIIEPSRSSADKWPFIWLGLMVYSVQGVLIYFLVKKYAGTRWIIYPFRGTGWLWGTVVALVVWLVANAFLALRLSEEELRLHSAKSLVRFLPVFLLHSLPGALIEEYLFRYLPVRFVEIRRLSRERTLLLFMAVLIFFTITHIPAYLWQYHNPLWSLWSPFTMGAAYFFVYYATRNLAFTTLFHAFHNNSWMLVGRSDVKDYSLVIVAAILWFFWRTSRPHRRY